MKFTTRILAFALGLGLAGAAFASPNLLGVSGLLLIPTADVVSEDAYSAYAFDVEDTDTLIYGFLYGIQENMEAGFIRTADEQTSVNFKFNFQPESTEAAGLAIGILDVTDQVDTALFLVASKPINIGEITNVDNIRLHAGIAGGGDQTVDGLFGGLSFDIADRFTLMLEHDSDNFNYGLNVAVTTGFLAHLGVLSGGEDQFFAGASYTSSF